MATDANRSKRLLEMIALNDLASVLLEVGSKPADAAFFIYAFSVQEPTNANRSKQSGIRCSSRKQVFYQELLAERCQRLPIPEAIIEGPATCIN